MTIDTRTRVGDPVTRTGDAFGRAVSRAWRRGGGPGVAYEIIERDDGMLTVNDTAKYFASFDQWNRVEQLACSEARGRVLDVGCGPGRHAVHLADHGVEVLGLEPSAGASAVARERGIQVVEAGVEDLDRVGGEYDTLLLGGQNLGLLGSREKAPTVLSALAGVSVPDGVLLGIGIDPYLLTGPVNTAYAEANRSAGRMPGHQRFRVRDGALATAWFDYLLMSPTELAELAQGTGWESARVTMDGPHYLARLVRRKR